MRILNKRIFLIVSLFIFFADTVFVLMNFYHDRLSLKNDLRQKSEQYQSSFNVALSMTTANMSQLATYVANDPHVREIFSKAARAHIDEGGGKGGGQSAYYRDRLYNEVVHSWAQMKDRFSVRQLHFHLPPKDTSFLRVHQPDKSGDDLSSLRHMIMDVMAHKQPQEGFELGRIYAGIRGAVPVFGPNEGKNKGAFIGTLEAGTSFSEIIDVLQKQIGTDVLILLNAKRVSDVKWKNGLGGYHKATCGCFVEASSDDNMTDIIPLLDLQEYRENSPFMLRNELIDFKGSRYALTTFGLSDYIGEKMASPAPVGRVVMWTNVDDKFAQLSDITLKNTLYAVIGFIVIELLIYFGLCAAQRQLHNEVQRQAGEISVLLDKAVQANKAKSEFLANMSHELRTPMMGIRGVLDLLKSDASLNVDTQNLLMDLDVSSDALMVLVDDVLDLSKIEAGKLNIEMAASNPAGIILETVKGFKAVADGKGLKLTSNAADLRDYWCQSDRLRVKQILNNLINNALKFTEKGSVEVLLELVKARPRDELKIVVRDTGIGMSPEQQKGIFERFQQADGSTTRKYGGTGLGVTISYQLAGLLNGDLSVRSQQHKGTTFTLTLPVTEAQSPSRKDQQHISLRPLDILLAEDNRVNQKVVATMLRKKGHRVDIANNGVQACDQAQGVAYDVILMDIQMPEMDGLEATRKIRASQGLNQKTMIIAFTADAIKEHRDNFYGAGVNGIITKPIKFDLLEDEINAFLQNKS